MSLAPKWAKAAAVLGLKMQILQLEVNADADSAYNLKELILVKLKEYEAEIDRIAAMKV